MTMNYQWLDTAEQVAELDRRWSHDAPLFLDTEFMRERTYWPALALVQINQDEGNWLIDPKPMSDGEPLKRLLSQRTLVMHGCSEDIETFKAWPGFIPAKIEDTQIAGALCGYDLQCGYQKIVELTQNVALPKGATRTDWLQRPLTAEQLEYAVQDVHYLPEVHRQLKAKLAERGRLAWWEEECARMLQDAAVEAKLDRLWAQVKGAGSLDGGARRNLRALAAWRDGKARDLNLPRSFIIKDVELLVLAQEASPTRSKLTDLGLHPSFIRKHAEEALAQIEAAQNDDIPDALPGMPDPAQRDMHKRLRKRVGEIAESLDVTPEILARRRWLEALTRNQEKNPDAMTGWRLKLVAEPLLEML